MKTNDLKGFIDFCISENEIIREMRQTLRDHSELFDIILGELKVIRQNMVLNPQTLTRHNDLLIDHGKRINKLETQSTP